MNESLEKEMDKMMKLEKQLYCMFYMNIGKGKNNYDCLKDIV